MNPLQAPCADKPAGPRGQRLFVTRHDDVIGSEKRDRPDSSRRFQQSSGCGAIDGNIGGNEFFRTPQAGIRIFRPHDSSAGDVHRCQSALLAFRREGQCGHNLLVSNLFVENALQCSAGGIDEQDLTESACGTVSG